jgi:hypothetical protein
MNTIDFGAGVVVVDNAAERIQIMFDEKPKDDLINKLRADGWRWNRHFSLWQQEIAEPAMSSLAKLFPGHF